MPGVELGLRAASATANSQPAARAEGRLQKKDAFQLSAAGAGGGQGCEALEGARPAGPPEVSGG